MSTSEPKKKEKAKGRPWLRWGLRACVGIVLLFGLLLAVLHTSWAKGKIKERVEAKLSQKINGELRIESLDYGFLFGSLQLQGIKVVSDAGSEVIAIDSLTIAIDRRATLAGTITIDSLLIEAPSIAVEIDADGNNSLKRLLKPQKGESAPLEIRSLKVRGLEILAHSPAGRFSFVEGAIRADLRKNKSVQAHIQSLSGEIAASHSQGSVKGQLSLGPLHLRKDADRLTVDSSALQFLYQVDRSHEPTMSGELKVNTLHMARIDSLIDVQVSEIILGPMRLAGLQLQGDLKDPAYQHHFAIASILVDTDVLSGLIHQKLPVGEMRGHLALKGPRNALKLQGGFEALEGTISIHGEADATLQTGPRLSATVDTNVAMEHLPLLPKAFRIWKPLLPSEIHIGIESKGIPGQGGSLQMSLDAFANSTEGPQKTLSIVAHLGEKKMKVDHLQLDVLGTRLTGGAAIVSSTAEAASSVRANLELQGNAVEVVEKLRALGLRLPRRMHLPSDLNVKVEVTGDMDRELHVKVIPSSTSIAGGTVSLDGYGTFTRSSEGLSLQSAVGQIGLHGLRVEKLAKMARKPATLQGRVNGRVGIKIKDGVPSISHFIEVFLPKYDVRVTAKGGAASSVWKGKVQLLDGASGKVLAWGKGRVPLSKTFQPRRRARIEAQGAVEMISLRSLEKRLGAKLKAKLKPLISAGDASLKFTVGGSLQSPHGSIQAQLRATPVNLATGQVRLQADLDIQGEKNGRITIEPTLSVHLERLKSEALKLSGNVVLLPKSSQHPSLQERVVVDLALQSPSRPLGAILRLLPRKLKQRIDTSLLSQRELRVSASLKGKMLAPELFAEANLLSTESGGTLRSSPVALRLQVSKEEVHAQLELAGSTPVRLSLDAISDADAWRLTFKTKVEDLLLADLIPTAKIPALRNLLGSARMASDLEFKAMAAKREGHWGLGSVSTQGELAVAVPVLALPQSDRRLRNLRFALTGKGDRLAVLVEAEEKDTLVAKRKAAATAELKLSTLSLGEIPRVSARVVAENWLLWGGILGKADAPRAQLDAAVAIVLDSENGMPVVDIDIESLRYWEPDRAVFIHEFESFSPKGDVVFRDESDVPVGKIGVAKKSQAVPPAMSPLGGRKALVRVHISKPIDVVKGPLHLNLSAELEVPVGYGDGPSGVVEFHQAELSLLDQVFAYEGSELVLGKTPVLVFPFVRKVPVDVQRGLSSASAGSVVRILLRPMGGGPLLSFEGAGNRTLMHAFSQLHTGRPYIYSQPDLPASATVRAPQGKQPMVLGFVHANIPRLHLFDRFWAWSNSYDEFGEYGQLLYLDAEKHFRSSLLHLQVQPSKIGRSSVEARYEKRLINSQTLSVGIGAAIGSRLGGGVGAFLEWNSKD